MTTYRVIGHLKKKVNWHPSHYKVDANILKAFFERDESSFNLDLKDQKYYDYNKEKWVTRKVYVVGYSHLTRNPVVSAQLIPEESYEGTSNIDWYRFKVANTDVYVYFSPTDIVKIMSELARDHRFYLTGDGTIRLTFTFRSCGGYIRCRLLNDEDKVINTEDK